MSQVGVPHRNATHDHKGQNTPSVSPHWELLVHFGPSHSEELCALEGVAGSPPLGCGLMICHHVKKMLDGEEKQGP